MFIVDAAKVAFGAQDGGAKEAANERARLASQGVDVEDQAEGMGRDERGKAAADFRLPVFLVVAVERASVDEDAAESGVPFALDLGEEMVADAVAVEGGVEVGSVLAPGEAAGGEPGEQLFAIDVEEGADDAVGGDWTDAGKPGGSGASQESEQDRFGLVGTGVAEGNAVEAELEAGTLEEGVAEAAGAFLEIAVARARIGFVDHDWKRQGPGEISDEGFVGRGFGSAEAVIDVQDGETVAQSGERAQEGDRVGAARDGDSDRAAAIEHVITRDSFGNAREQEPA